MEQKNDDQPSLENLRNTLQLSSNVRAREVRQEPKAGTAEERLHRRPARRTEPELRQQQQQPPQQAPTRQGRPPQRKPKTSELRAGHHVQPDVQSVPARLLPRISARFPDAAEHAASSAAE